MFRRPTHVIWSGNSPARPAAAAQARTAQRLGQYVRAADDWQDDLRELGIYEVTTTARRPGRYHVTLPAAQWANQQRLAARVQRIA